MLNGYALNSQALNSALTGINWQIEFDGSIDVSSSAIARIGKPVVGAADMVVTGGVDAARGADVIWNPQIITSTDALFGLQARVVVDFDIIFPAHIAEYVVAATSILPHRFFVSAHFVPDAEYHDYRYTGGEATIQVHAESVLHGQPGSPVNGEPAAEFVVCAETRAWQVPAVTRETGERSTCLA